MRRDEKFTYIYIRVFSVCAHCEQQNRIKKIKIKVTGRKEIILYIFSCRICICIVILLSTIVVLAYNMSFGWVNFWCIFFFLLGNVDVQSYFGAQNFYIFFSRKKRRNTTQIKTVTNVCFLYVRTLPYYILNMAKIVHRCRGCDSLSTLVSPHLHIISCFGPIQRTNIMR